MKFSELLRLVRINILQNKFKVILTSIGIVVGAATIVMVIAIGKGGKMDVAEQFKNLNAGAIDISYEIATDSSKSGKERNSGSGFTMPNMGAGGMQKPPGVGEESGSNSGKGQGSTSDSTSGQRGGFSGGMSSFGQGFIMGGKNGFDMSDRLNQEKVVLTEDDADDIEVFVPDITGTTISYTTKSDVEGGDLTEAQSYTIAAVKNNYAEFSNFTLQIGEFISSENEENKDKVCILGAQTAKEIFGDVVSAYDSTIYIDERPYIVNGVLSEMGTVASGISPDDAVFIPYSSAVKYISGNNISPTITVIADDVENIDTVVTNIETILGQNYANAEFTITDAGSKMKAASSTNDTLTTLLIAMAAIVFIVGGIGIMNVLFVSVKERTNEIGILKALGCTKKDILLEFLFEAAVISIIGGLIGVLISFGITPIVERWNLRVELSSIGAGLAVIFALITGTIFGFYPAWKASRLVPIEALNQE